MYETPVERQEAARVLEILARGVNPVTDSPLEASVFDEAPVIRALYSGARALRILGGAREQRASRGGKEMTGKRWTVEEENRLRKAFAGQFRVVAVAKDHGRTVGAIRSRLVGLGLISERDAVS